MNNHVQALGDKVDCICFSQIYLQHLKDITYTEQPDTNWK